jgi:hypothetical protein
VAGLCRLVLFKSLPESSSSWLLGKLVALLDCQQPLVSSRGSCELCRVSDVRPA